MRSASSAGSLVRIAIAGVCLAAAAASASKPTLRLERIDPSAFACDGKLRVFASLVELEGQIDDGRQAFTLRIDGKQTFSPDKIAPFRSAAVPLDLVLVIETSALYGVQRLPPPNARRRRRRRRSEAEAQGKAKSAPQLAPPVIAPETPRELPLDRVKEALAGLLEARPAQTRVLIVDYGGEVTPHPPFRAPAAAQSALEDLSPDDESGDVHLSSSMRCAPLLVELNRPRTDDTNGRRRDGSSSSSATASTRRWIARPSARSATRPRSPACPSMPSRFRRPTIAARSSTSARSRSARTAPFVGHATPTISKRRSTRSPNDFYRSSNTCSASRSRSFDQLEGHSFENCRVRRSALEPSSRFEAGASVFGYTGADERLQHRRSGARSEWVRAACSAGFLASRTLLLGASCCGSLNRASARRARRGILRVPRRPRRRG